MRPLAPLERLEWLADDLRSRTLAQRQDRPHPDIVIVDIDDASLAELGRWPWGRDRIATLIDLLFERQQVAALGVDLVFSEPDPGDPDLLALVARDPELAARWPAWRQALDRDHRLARALAGRPVVLGWYLSADRGGVRIGAPPAPAASVPRGLPTPGLAAWNGFGANRAPLRDAAPRAGVFNALPDDDGVVRAVAALYRLDDGLHESLALALWRCATGDPRLAVHWRPELGPAGPLELAQLAYAAVQRPDQARHLPVDEHGALRVPFRGRGGPQGHSFRYVPAADVLAGRVADADLKGKLVLLGSSAPGLSDLRATPIHPALPGVEVHAQLLAGLLDDHLPQRPSWAAGYEAVAATLLLMTATALALLLPAPLAMAGMGGLVLLFLTGTWLAQSQGQRVLPVAAMLLLAIIQFMLAVAVRYVDSWRQRRTLVELFGSYLPPERVRQLVRQNAGAPITAENRELSVLFCDLQGFSGLAERLSPLALRDVLNRYFSDSSAIVHAHGGTLDKFIGDAVMAFWGAPLPQPDHAARAVQAALDLADGLGPLNRHLAAQQLPTVRYGIGLATGWVCVGDLGSQLRRTYTAVGDAVNLAARLEALTRELGVGLLVDEATYRASLDRLPDLLWIEVGDHAVRGRAQGVTLFTPLRVSPAVREGCAPIVRTWQLALAAARQHHGEAARQQLAHLEALLADSDPLLTETTSLLRHLASRLSLSLARPATGPASA